ncbi:MAG TPA: hypothetical protein VNO79_08325, partial [Actinomycetota bacterium]|nr:hypothetical protein [Actinomycetota bacterium]
PTIRVPEAEPEPAPEPAGPAEPGRSGDGPTAPEGPGPSLAERASERRDRSQSLRELFWGEE